MKPRNILITAIAATLGLLPANSEAGSLFDRLKNHQIDGAINPHYFQKTLASHMDGIQIQIRIYKIGNMEVRAYHYPISEHIFGNRRETIFSRFPFMYDVTDTATGKIEYYSDPKRNGLNGDEELRGNKKPEDLDMDHEPELVA